MTPSDPARTGSAPGPVLAALLSLAVLQAVLSFSAAARVEYVGNYDTAYYYAVARNVALGPVSRADNVLWHWLGRPETVARPPGDLWSPGWPLLLGAAMALAGHTMKDAILLCASLSIALPLLVFTAAWLIRRDLLIAWLAGLVLIPQERDRESSIMPDVALPHQVCLMLGLCLFLWARRAAGRARPAWTIAGFVLTVPLWLRGEGFIVPAAAAAALLLDSGLELRERVGRLRWLLLGAAACAVPFLGYNLWAFGAIVPGPRALTPYLTDFADYYRYATDPGFKTWIAQGAGRILHTIGFVLRARAAHPFHEIPILLLVLAAWGALAGGGRRLRDGRLLAFVFVVLLTWCVPAILAPIPSRNPGPFVQAATPIVCVLAALGLGRLMEPFRRNRSAVATVCIVFITAGSVWFWPLQVRNPASFEAWQGRYRPIPGYLQPSGHPALGPADLVMTTDPCQVAAVLDVPAMMLPIDGPDAVREAVQRYHPRYLLLPDQTQWWQVAKAGRRRDALAGLEVREVARAADGRWYAIDE